MGFCWFFFHPGAQWSFTAPGEERALRTPKRATRPLASPGSSPENPLPRPKEIQLKHLLSPCDLLGKTQIEKKDPEGLDSPQKRCPASFPVRSCRAGPRARAAQITTPEVLLSQNSVILRAAVLIHPSRMRQGVTRFGDTVMPSLGHHEPGGPARDPRPRLQAPKLANFGVITHSARQARPPPAFDTSAGGSERPGCPCPALAHLPITDPPGAQTEPQQRTKHLPALSIPPPDSPVH